MMEDDFKKERLNLVHAFNRKPDRLVFYTVYKCFDLHSFVRDLRHKFSILLQEAQTFYS